MISKDSLPIIPATFPREGVKEDLTGQKDSLLGQRFNACYNKQTLDTSHSYECEAGIALPPTHQKESFLRHICGGMGDSE